MFDCYLIPECWIWRYKNYTESNIKIYLMESVKMYKYSMALLKKYEA